MGASADLALPIIFMILLSGESLNSVISSTNRIQLRQYSWHCKALNLIKENLKQLKNDLSWRYQRQSAENNQSYPILKKLLPQ